VTKVIKLEYFAQRAIIPIPINSTDNKPALSSPSPLLFLSLYLQFWSPPRTKNRFKMAAAIKAINARIRANPVLDYFCSTRTSLVSYALTPHSPEGSPGISGVGGGKNWAMPSSYFQRRKSETNHLLSLLISDTLSVKEPSHD
jgi:hypothetical protein